MNRSTLDTKLPCPSPYARALPAARRGARLFSVVGGLIAAAFLTGAHDNGCTIVITPNHECTELDDVCPNLECEVYKTDDDGCSLCECEEPPPPPPPTGCYSDADCAEGEYCEYIYDEPQPADDGDDNSEESPLMAPQGECRPLNCDDDVSNGDPAMPEPLCGPGEEAQWIDDRCGGYFICVPVQQGCLDDSECREGQHCELYEACPPCGSDGNCDAPCYVEGVCVDDEPTLSCANVLCAEGYLCKETEDGPQCVPVEGQCDDDSQAVCDMVPPTCDDGLIAAVRNGCYACVDPATCQEPPRGCYSDDECAADERCNAAEICDAPPGCSDDASCLTVCYGQCVPLDDTTDGEQPPDEPTDNSEPGAP